MMMEGKLLKPISFSTTAPSSPGRNSCTNIFDDFYFSEPTSPTHLVKAGTNSISAEDVRARALPFSWDADKSSAEEKKNANNDPSFEFEFSSRCSEADSDPVSAEELFLNGQIRPLNQSVGSDGRTLCSPRPALGSTNTGPDGKKDKGEDSVSSGSAQNRTRGRNSLRSFLREEDGNKSEDKFFRIHEGIKESKSKDSKSSFRGLSKRWCLKDFLYRSSSEGSRASTGKDRLWGFPLIPPAKQAHKHIMSKKNNGAVHAGKNSLKPNEPTSKHVSRRYDEREIAEKSVQNPQGAVNGSAAQELQHKAYRSQEDEGRRKSFLPYKRGLLSCLGFTTNSFGNMTGFTRTLHPFSSNF